MSALRPEDIGVKREERVGKVIVGNKRELKGKNIVKIGGSAEQPFETGSSALIVVTVYSRVVSFESVWSLKGSGVSG